jgi:hypothetical protein
MVNTRKIILPRDCKSMGTSQLLWRRSDVQTTKRRMYRSGIHMEQRWDNSITYSGIGGIKTRHTMPVAAACEYALTVSSLSTSSRKRVVMFRAKVFLAYQYEERHKSADIVYRNENVMKNRDRHHDKLPLPPAAFKSKSKFFTTNKPASRLFIWYLHGPHCKHRVPQLLHCCAQFHYCCCVDSLLRKRVSFAVA